MLDTLERVFLHIFEGLNARCALEIEAVRRQFPFADLKFKRPAFRFTFREATQMLREHGPAIGAEQLAALEAQQAKAEAAGREEEVKEAIKLIADHKAHMATVPTHGELEDISTRDEKLLGAVMNRVKGIDFYVIDKFPADLRPFYTMPDPADPAVSNSYDIFIRGEEVTSGAQRIHDSAMLLARAKSMEVLPPSSTARPLPPPRTAPGMPPHTSARHPPPRAAPCSLSPSASPLAPPCRLSPPPPTPQVDLTPLTDYVKSFQYGAHPHAGGGIGLERVVMLFLNLDNIRKTSMFPRDPNRLTP